MDLDEAIKRRRSIRKYKADVPIPQEHIEAIIEAGCWAPSSANTQPWRFIVVTDRETIASMAKVVYDKFHAVSKEALHKGENRVAAFARFVRGHGGFFAGAPLVIVACTRPFEFPLLKMPTSTLVETFRELEQMDVDVEPIVVDTVQKSVAMAVQNMVLKAHSLGYGSCVMDAPIAVEGALREMLDIEDELQLVMVIPIGVPVSRRLRPPERLPLAEVVRYHQP
jgi:nitroreductase